ncbi:DMT family transporter [Phormidium sp. CCY1219]|uniref:DMT family transporter n=1 Tax=Phormidium sp. CCY1219 TaxID=2886104 RepID=UPI002D1F57A3|nr:DMT family transporter [Phormidium sp. CCY1219]MEB3826500.1 DMT family transporter [Phormidium sp. CCY1219]
MKPSPWKVCFILTCGVLAVSTAAILIRLALDAADLRGAGFSLVLAASRLTVAALMLLPAWGKIYRNRIPRSALGYAVAAGACLTVHFASWITSLSYTSIAASTTIVTTNPVWIALFSWLWLGEKPSRQTSMGIAIALVGGAIVGLGSNNSSYAGSNPLLGNFLALVGSWTVSWYLLLGREAQKRGMGIGGYSAIAYATAALLLLPMPFLFNASYTGYSPEVYLYIVLMAAIPQLVGHTSFNWAISWISPTVVTLAILFEPVCASILGFLVFGEIPGISVLVGGVVVLVGVAIAAIGSRK